MAVTIGSNISALQAQRQLARSTDSLSATSERLASGLRINRASDDAAGLAISSSLRADSRVFAQGIRNINDGVSAINIAQGSLQQLSDIVTRQMELAEQAANGTYSTRQRDGLQDEADALTSEFNRILGTTSFNGINLFQSPNTALQLQAGYGTDGILSSSVGRQLSRRQGDGTFSSASLVSAVGVGNQSVVTADFDGDGNSDLYIARGFSDARVYLGNGDGTFRQVQNMGAATVGSSAYSSDINGDGKVDLIDMHFTSGNINIKLGNGDGTFLAPTTVTAMQDEGNNIRFGDINGDGKMDMLVSHSNNTNNVETWLGNGNGTFSYGMSFGPGNGFNNTGANSLLADFDNDGKLDIVLGYHQHTKFLRGNGDGTFAAAVTVSAFNVGTAVTSMQVADVNRDGKLDFIANDANGYTSILMGNGDGTFAAFRTIATGAGVASANMAFADMNNDGYLDIVMRSGTTNAVTLFGNGDGTFGNARTTTLDTSSGTNFGLADFNGDGAIDLLSSGTAATDARIHFANGNLSANTEYYNLITQQEARSSLDRMRQVLNRINLETGSIGAYLSRMQTALGVMGVARENYLGADSRISDADVASESADYVRLQILQKGAAAILGQANQQPALALKLLNSV